jgi:putative transposase
MTEPSLEKSGRHSIRLKGYDYSQGGGYFFTIVTFERDCIFGKVNDGEMQVNALGRIVQDCLNEIPAHFPNAGIDSFIIMPNHVHGILFIYDDVFVGARYISPLQKPSLQTPLQKPSLQEMPQSSQQQQRPHGFKPRSLGAIIASFKAAVTRRAGRELDSGNIWQRNYYEHILRDHADYERVAGYIFNNPLHWADDEEYPW